MSGSDLRLITAALDGLAVRHRVTVANLANQSTPGYRRRTVSFEDQLGRATHGARIEPKIEVDRSRGNADGNNVEPEREVGELNRVEIAYQLLSLAMSHKASLLRAAITGRA